MRVFKAAIISIITAILLLNSCIIMAYTNVLNDISPGKALEYVYFFGDSTTAHLKLRGGIPSERVWTGIGNTVLYSTVNETKCVYFETENRSITIAEAVCEKNPPILVITLGVSGGAGFMPEEKFKNVYRRLIESVRKNCPETLLLVQSILPLSRKSTEYYKKLTKEAVLEANKWIYDVCSEEDIPYINTHALLADTDGYLKTIYEFDGYMHLTSAAYRVILENIRESIQKHLFDK